MPDNNFNFDLLLKNIEHAAIIVSQKIMFDFGFHGLIIALLFLIASKIVTSEKYSKYLKYKKPFEEMAKKLSIVCGVFMIPGLFCLIMHGKLPQAGVYNINSLGYLGLWSLISLFMSLEEMNHEWFD